MSLLDRSKQWLKTTLDLQIQRCALTLSWAGPFFVSPTNLKWSSLPFWLHDSDGLQKIDISPARPESAWTLNTDGSFDPINGRGGIGAALYNPAGELVACLAKPVHIGLEVNNGPSCAEYAAACAGLDLAYAAGAKDVFLYTDNQSLASFTQSTILHGSPRSLGQTQLDSHKRALLSKLPQFDGLCANWIRRNNNMLADQLSKIGTGKQKMRKATIASRSLAKPSHRDKQPSVKPSSSLQPPSHRSASHARMHLCKFPEHLLGPQEGSQHPIHQVAFVHATEQDGIGHLASGSAPCVEGLWQPPPPSELRFSRIPNTVNTSVLIAQTALHLAHFLCAKKDTPHKNFAILLFNTKAFDMLCSKMGEVYIPPDCNVSFILHSPQAATPQSILQTILTAQHELSIFEPKIGEVLRSVSTRPIGPPLSSGPRKKLRAPQFGYHP